MIEIKQNGSDIEVKVDYFVPTKGVYCRKFRHTCANEELAAFVSSAMRDQMSGALRSIKETAYDKGWADAKAKRKKQDWFGGGW